MKNPVDGFFRLSLVFVGGFPSFVRIGTNRAVPVGRLFRGRGLGPPGFFVYRPAACNYNWPEMPCNSFDRCRGIFPAAAQPNLADSWPWPVPGAARAVHC